MSTFTNDFSISNSYISFKIFCFIISGHRYEAHLPPPPENVVKLFLEWTDNLYTTGNDLYAHYYVVAILEIGKTSTADTTNVVSTGIEFNKIKTYSSLSANRYNLEQNYPNPFNPSTVINFSVEKNSFASLKVYDILGNEVVVLLNKKIEAGNHSIEFNAEDLPSGIYLYHLQTREFSKTRKMIFLK